jgi:lactate 2-monooxygenase
MISQRSDRQKDIYLNGFAGISPEVPIDFNKLQLAAEKVMTPRAFAYITGGAGRETTIDSNQNAFAKYQIIPRMLRDVSQRDISIELFGHKFPSPFLLSPIGVLELAHKDADIAVARAATATGVPYIFSNQSSKTMEACASVMQNSPRWFQLYWSKSNRLVQSFVSRAEQCGCSAIVLTLDTTMLGWRTRDLDMAYLPFMEGKGIAQYTSDPVFQQMMDEPDQLPVTKQKISMQSLTGLIEMVKGYPGSGFLNKLRSGRPVKAVRTFVSSYSNPATTWKDLEFLRSQTKLPILLKGILHPHDAAKTIDHGMDGIIVSNHGGRQVDGSIATLDALPGIVSTVNDKIPVLLDSGIRGGADAFKALALGAKAVCIGRPYAYGLALAGENGVKAVIKNYIADFELTMGLAGCKNISEIKRDALVA